MSIPMPVIKPGDFVSIKSPDGGCVKAPCTKEVMTVVNDGFGFISKDDEDRGYIFGLKQENFLGTIHIKSANPKTVHQFSK